MMAIFTHASRATRISAAAYPTRAQLAAITRMLERIEPILRLQSVRSVLSAIDGKQFQVFAKSIYGVQMATAIQLALWYLEQNHPDVYREIVPDVKLQPAQPKPEPIPSTCPRKKVHIRRRTLDKAVGMTGRTGYIIKNLDSKIQSMPSDKLSNLLSLLLGIGSITPSEYAHSISLLCFVITAFLTFHHKGQHCDHKHKTD